MYIHAALATIEPMCYNCRPSSVTKFWSNWIFYIYHFRLGSFLHDIVSLMPNSASFHHQIEHDVSPPKVETTASAARDAADNLVQLYKRISLDHELDEAVRSDFLRRLAGAAGATQHNLARISANSSAAATTTTTVAVTGGHNVSPTHGR